MHRVVQRRVDAVPGQHREPDLAERAGKLARELRFVLRTAVQEPPKVERRDLIVVVELIRRTLGEAIGMRLCDLVVLFEFLVQRFDAAHGTSLAPAGGA